MLATGRRSLRCMKVVCRRLIPLTDEACGFFWILNLKMVLGTSVRDLSRFNLILKADFLTVAINSFQQLAPVGLQ